MSNVIQTLRDLIRISSINPAYEHGRDEDEIQQYVRNFFEARRIPVEEQFVAPGRSNLIAKIPGRHPERRLLFEAHCDTAGIEGMVIPPFDPQVRDGRVYGRGACDVKGGLAAMMHAAADVHAAGNAACEIWMVSAVDEEHAYRGVAKFCEAGKADGAVVAEPTGLRMTVASKGCLRWRINVKGRAAHSSVPHTGVNAIQAMARLLIKLDEHAQSLAGMRHDLVGSPTLTVGRIDGGTQVNIVPENCWAEVDRRLIPGEDPSEVLSFYEQFLRQPGLNGSLSMTFEPLLKDWPLNTPLDADVVRSAACVLRDIGLDDRPVGVAFGSDASKLRNIGIPSLIFGPGSIEYAHAAEEYVETKEVEQARIFYRELMCRFN